MQDECFTTMNHFHYNVHTTYRGNLKRSAGNSTASPSVKVKTNKLWKAAVFVFVFLPAWTAGSVQKRRGESAISGTTASWSRLTSLIMFVLSGSLLPINWHVFRRLPKVSALHNVVYSTAWFRVNEKEGCCFWCSTEEGITGMFSILSWMSHVSAKSQINDNKLIFLHFHLYALNLS